MLATKVKEIQKFTTNEIVKKKKKKIKVDFCCGMKEMGIDDVSLPTDSFYLLKKFQATIQCVPIVPVKDSLTVPKDLILESQSTKILRIEA